MRGVVDDIIFEDIADAIREGIEAPDSQFSPNDMAEAIRYANEESYNKGSSDGYGVGFEEGEEFGYQEGYDAGEEWGLISGHEDGYKEGFTEGTEAGKKAQYDEFWDAFREGIGLGTGSLNYAFAETQWNIKTFTLNFKIAPQSAERIFYRHNRFQTNYDLAEQLQKYGGSLDFARATTMSYAFSECFLSRVPEINVSNATLTCIFQNFKGTTIDKIVVSNNAEQNFTNSFIGCTALKNILFEGVIGRNISFSASPLSVESMKSIISCLKDYSTEAPFTYTLTLNDSCKTELEADTETIEFNGQNYTYFELITAKGWNLA